MAASHSTRGRKSVSLAMSASHKPKDLSRLASVLSDVARAERWERFWFLLVTDDDWDDAERDREEQLMSILQGHLSNCSVVWRMKKVASSSPSLWTQIIEDAICMGATDVMVDSKVWRWTAEEFSECAPQLPPNCHVWIVDKNGRKRNPLVHSHAGHTQPKPTQTAQEDRNSRFGGKGSSPPLMSVAEYLAIPLPDSRSTGDRLNGMGGRADGSALPTLPSQDASPSHADVPESPTFYPPSALPYEARTIGGPGPSGRAHTAGSRQHSQAGEGSSQPPEVRQSGSSPHRRTRGAGSAPMYVPWDEDSPGSAGGTSSPTGNVEGEISIDIDLRTSEDSLSDQNDSDDDGHLSGSAWNIIPSNGVVDPRTYYTIFISYRFKTDNFHAELLYHRLKERIIELRKQRKMTFRFFIFLDIKSLKLAEKWREHLFEALSQSHLFLPLVSREGVEGFRDTERVDSGRDNLLLEWERALQLEQEGTLEIVPLLVKSVGAANKFSREMLPPLPERAQSALDKIQEFEGRHLSMEEDRGLTNDLAEVFLDIIQRDQELSAASSRPSHNKNNRHQSMTVAELAVLGSGPRDSSRNAEGP